MKTPNRRNLLILAFALAVVTIGFGVVMPIIPFYMERLGAGGTELGLLVASYAVMRLIFGPIWGTLSDRVGRKPIMMIGVIGYGITMVGFGLATKLWMMFAARILSGVLSSATSPTTMAYIGDSTTEEDRSRGMGVLGAAGGMGTIFGPALGGLLADWGLSVPFFFAAGMALLSVLLIAVFLPESLPIENRRTSQERQLPLNLKAWWEALFSPIGPLLVQSFIVMAGMTLFFGIFGLYALEHFQYGTQEVGVVFTVLGLMMAVGQGLLVGPMTKRWGDVRVMKVGFLFSAVGLIAMMAADRFWLLLVATGFFSLANALVSPSVSALTSKRTSMDQGVTMGLSNAFGSLGRIAGPPLGGLAYDLDWRWPFIGAAVVMGAGFLVSYGVEADGG
ncbi:MAG: MFS transporter [Anaerolineales bacterium]|jgi:DHA1 family multidrug resistance protein-like MFS transporter